MPEEDHTAIQVCVRVRPLNKRELEEGNRVCVHIDDPSKQVILTAVDKTTLLQLKGQTARGYAFDRRYSMESTSDHIYTDCVAKLVENCFKGYNATVLAYGQTGSGKTHTMSGGTGIHGVKEEGITRRVIRHMFSIIEQIRKRMKPGESLSVGATAMEIYNEDLRDLSKTVGGDGARGWDGVGGSKGSGLKITEKPGRSSRNATEIQGLKEQTFEDADQLMAFFESCISNRSISSTKLNDQSSRSHAIFTISLRRVIVHVSNTVNPETMKAMIHTESVTSKLHLVDLAGSERVKRSGVTGKELKEATHINSGLLALGNVIVALAESPNGHIPYRDSKLTRILQDSLGGNSLTVLVTCISPSEADFEETNNTLKYSNRACNIKNTPLPNKYIMLEEDLLPLAPPGKDGQVSSVNLASLLEDHLRQREIRERREKEKLEKERKRKEQLHKAKESLMSTPGYQRVLAQEYDRKLKEAKAKGKKRFATNETIDGTVLREGTRKRLGGADKNGGKLHLQELIWGQGLEDALPASSPEGSPQQQLKAVEAVQEAGSDCSDITDDQEELCEHHTEQQKEEHAHKQQVQQQQQQEEEEEEEEEDVPAWVRRRRERAKPAAAVAASGAGPTGPEGAGAASAQQQSGGGLDDSALSAAAQQRSPAAAMHEAHGEAMVSEGSDSSTAEELDSSKFTQDGDAESDDVLEDDPASPPARQLLQVTLEDLPSFLPLARFKINKHDLISVFKAQTKEDFEDVVKLLPENTPLPASDKMTYLIARLESTPHAENSLRMQDRLRLVVELGMSMEDAIGPAVGCLMATFGTNMISSCIFDFDECEALETYGVQDRIELWGLQIPHNSVRPTLKEQDAETKEADMVIQWTSIDRLNMSVGLLYALCSQAEQSGIRCGFCVPRPQLLRRWQQAGVKMRQVEGQQKLIYPPHAHDYEYYKSSTVAYFFVDEVQEGLRKVLSLSAS